MKKAEIEIHHEKGRQHTAVLVLHGLGADYTDLRPIRSWLDPSGELDWFFLNAPFSYQFGGRQWFQIDMNLMALAMQTARPTLFTETLPLGLEQSRQLLSEVVSNIQQDFHSLVLMGFSQGGMVATDFLFSGDGASSKIDRALLMSTAPINEANWKKHKTDLTPLSVLQTHGTEDMVLPFSEGERLGAYYKSANSYEFVSAPGGHGVDPSLRTKLHTFLMRP